MGDVDESSNMCAINTTNSADNPVCASLDGMRITGFGKSDGQIFALDGIKAPIYSLPQCSQPISRMRVRFVEQAGALSLAGKLAMSCSTVEAPRVVTGPGSKHDADAIRLKFGILVETARHDFGTVSDQVLHHRVAALRLAAGCLPQRADQAGLLSTLR